MTLGRTIGMEGLMSDGTDSGTARGFWGGVILTVAIAIFIYGTDGMGGWECPNPPYKIGQLCPVSAEVFVEDGIGMRIFVVLAYTLLAGFPAAFYGSEIIVDKFGPARVNGGEASSAGYASVVEEGISVAEAAEIHGVTEATIRRWIKEDRLTGYKDEKGRWRISR